jgi:hypothetical protein
MSSSVIGGAHPHVAHDRRHHPRREFLRSGVAAAAVGAIALLSLHPHSLGVGAAARHGDVHTGAFAPVFVRRIGRVGQRHQHQNCR